jgi:juvenile hormone-III synthase
MHNGKLYMNFNFAQRKTALEVLDEFSHLLNWSISERGKLLDIGTGSGDVLIEFIVPKLPENVEVYGSDISKEMVKFARENFGGELSSFHQVDICADFEVLAKKLPQPFDNITSFFCFHWIQDQR